jgi:hypothetical protein
VPPISKHPDLGPPPHVADLSCHPGFPGPGIHSLQARVGFLDPEVLSLGFTLTGELRGLRIPEPALPARTDRLWEHTCFEAFLSGDRSEAYWEFNLAPSGAWAVYHFQRYREGGAPTEGLEPRLVVHRRPDRLDVHALLRLGPDLAGRPLRLGLTAVLEHVEGGLSYWALRHREGSPDFHHPSTFALDLTPEA